MALHHQMFLIMIMLLCGHIPHESKPCNIHHQTDHNTITASLETLNLDGYFEFDDWNTALAARDFGNRFHFPPLGVLHPKSVFDIATTVRHVFHTGGLGDVTVAARGHGHSLQGQAQAHGGIVINMESLNPWPMRIIVRKGEYDDYVVEVSGGELWIDVLRETLKYGLAPNSWTDYLHLTVGGTLSNGGISGQAFRHGPQINNVHHLEVVTGKGDVMNCSEKENPELFFGVLGGLAQFGIITRATITLEPAPSMVKWIRVLYSDFSKFSRDQELLISMEQTFNYIEGFVVINSTGLLNNWRSSFHPKDPVHATQFISDAKTLYCLEVAKYYNPNNDETEVTDMQIQELLSQLSYIPSTLFLSQVPYLDFLDRVHVSELKLRAKGMWDVPHPWLSLLIPRSKMVDFANEVFVNVLKGSSNGPILIYPLNQSMWNTVSRTSLITPEEHVFYHVTFLASAVPSSTGRNGLEHILARNQRILDFCSAAGLGVKRYLPHYTTQEEWKNHFGSKWEVFLRRKLAYDPLAILAPGHRIFKRESQIHQQIITEELLRQT